MTTEPASTQPMTTPLSILDLATVDRGTPIGEALANCVTVAQRAEALGYERVWYAEHHNIRSIASSATGVLIAHVAANTSTIRLGSGGVMLPNHSPLVIAEQYGTLAELHPGRIDLGLGRAPGTDQTTFLALRRDPSSSEAFPQDVQELQGYLSDESRVPGVKAIPGQGTHVPLYILGSSLFGAQLAALLGLPYGFASHFAPEALHQAVALYRREFRPSEQLAEPYVIAGVGAIAADTDDDAQAQVLTAKRRRVHRFLTRGDEPYSDERADALIASPQGQQVLRMMTYCAAGDHDEVRRYLEWFAGHAEADELIVAHQGPTAAQRLRSVEIVAEAAALTPTD